MMFLNEMTSLNYKSALQTATHGDCCCLAALHVAGLAAFSPLDRPGFRHINDFVTLGPS